MKIKIHPFLLIILILFFSSCGRNKTSQTIETYKTLINQVDSIQIEYPYTKKKKSLSKELVKNFKSTLVNHIEPEFPRKFKSDAKINLFKENKLIGVLNIIDDNKEKSFANFSSDDLFFGFRMTYGIGMFLIETHNSE